VPPDVVDVAEGIVALSKGDLFYYLFLAAAIAFIVGVWWANRGRKSAREEIERALERL
jgi:hypothetical protein